MTASGGFRELYEREFAAVYRAAYALSGDRSLAEEATQEAFARALARWPRLAGEPWAGGWVMTTALNFARRQMRKRPLVVRQVVAEVDAESLLDLRHAIGALPARQQTAVVLHYLMSLPLEEVAGAMPSPLWLRAGRGYAVNRAEDHPSAPGRGRSQRRPAVVDFLATIALLGREIESECE